MINKQIVIEHPIGVYSRPAALLVQVASKFSSYIWIEKNEKRANAKSIMGLMSLVLCEGDKINLIADGTDENIAIEAIEKLINSNFDEKMVEELTK
ncbi:HPr family phosphocarrier protein [Caldicellulosiruptoraceae bacterium PP1]